MRTDRKRHLEDRADVGVFTKVVNFDGLPFTAKAGWEQFQHEVKFHGARYDANRPAARLLLLGADREVIEDINDPLPTAAELLEWVRAGDREIMRRVAEAALAS